MPHTHFARAPMQAEQLKVKRLRTGSLGPLPEHPAMFTEARSSNPGLVSTPSASYTPLQLTPLLPTLRSGSLASTQHVDGAASAMGSRQGSATLLANLPWVSTGVFASTRASPAMETSRGSPSLAGASSAAASVLAGSYPASPALVTPRSRPSHSLRPSLTVSQPSATSALDSPKPDAASLTPARSSPAVAEQGASGGGGTLSNLLDLLRARRQRSGSSAVLASRKADDARHSGRAPEHILQPRSSAGHGRTLSDSWLPCLTRNLPVLTAPLLRSRSLPHARPPSCLCMFARQVTGAGRLLTMPIHQTPARRRRLRQRA